jgi:hypothetical protein
MVNCKKSVYTEQVPLSIKKIFKQVAYKFYEYCTDLKLRKKIVYFKSLVLVLRGRNVDH